MFFETLNVEKYYMNINRFGTKRDLLVLFCSTYAEEWSSDNGFKCLICTVIGEPTEPVCHTSTSLTSPFSSPENSRLPLVASFLTDCSWLVSVCKSSSVLMFHTLIVVSMEAVKSLSLKMRR